MPIWTEFNQLALKYNAVNLNHGTPTLTPPDFMIENMVATVREGANNHYTQLQGHPALRQQIATHFGKLLDRPVDPNTEVIVTNGALGAIFSVIMNFADKNSEVLMFEPYFTLYVNNIEFSGAKIVTAPMFTQENKW